MYLCLFCQFLHSILKFRRFEFRNNLLDVYDRCIRSSTRLDYNRQTHQCYKEVLIMNRTMTELRPLNRHQYQILSSYHPTELLQRFRVLDIREHRNNILCQSLKT